MPSFALTQSPRRQSARATTASLWASGAAPSCAHAEGNRPREVRPLAAAAAVGCAAVARAPVGGTLSRSHVDRLPRCVSGCGARPRWMQAAAGWGGPTTPPRAAPPAPTSGWYAVAGFVLMFTLFVAAARVGRWVTSLARRTRGSGSDVASFTGAPTAARAQSATSGRVARTATRPIVSKSFGSMQRPRLSPIRDMEEEGDCTTDRSESSERSAPQGTAPMPLRVG